MRIKRFNEMNSDSLSEESQTIVHDLNDSCDNGVIEWIANISEKSKSEEIKKYSNICGITDSDPKDENFINERGLKNTIQYLKTGKEIVKLNERIEKLQPKMEVEYWESAYELLYHFQEDLIHYDFNLLLELFENDGDEEYSEILPELKEKYKDIIETSRESSKYNF